MILVHALPSSDSRTENSGVIRVDPLELHFFLSAWNEALKVDFELLVLAESECSAHVILEHDTAFLAWVDSQIVDLRWWVKMWEGRKEGGKEGRKEGRKEIWTGIVCSVSNLAIEVDCTNCTVGLFILGLQVLTPVWKGRLAKSAADLLSAER
jgi:hypothetical protein